MYQIDSLVRSNCQCLKRLNDGKWYMARPCRGPLRGRLLDAWEVLRGRADAIIFQEDIEDKAQ